MIICRGNLPTPELRGMPARSRKLTAESTAGIPVGRYGRPDEYSDVVAFLAGNRSCYVTGSVARVDGGLIPSL